jgi:hypothetical protein
VTCIVGLVEGGVVYIGGDSAGVSGYDLTVRADEKVFQNGPFLFGFTSSFRMGQILRFSFRPPDHDPRVDVDKFMVTTFIDAVRDCLQKGGYARKQNEVESGGTFLVGYQGQLFTIYSDYQVAKSAHPFAAVGCGESYALGNLLATADCDMEPKDRVFSALNAAEEFSAGVKHPFVVRELRANSAQEEG